MDGSSFVTKEEFWRLQSTVNDLTSTQTSQGERIMRLENGNERGGNSNGSTKKGLWGPSSPFPSALGHTGESSLNPAAEAFRNFDNDMPTNMISSLTLDTNDDARRAASRAASVRFDESANHYAPSRQSIDLPARTGSGLGSHPMSERSLSHRSDGRSSTVGYGRANSFGIENSKLLGAIHNSPRVSGHPPPGLFMLDPCPAIVRCWLSEIFTNDSLLYAALCTGAAHSTVCVSLLQSLGYDKEIFEENGLRKCRLPVYLTEAKINLPSSRSGSPAPLSVPVLRVKFLVDDEPVTDKSIQIVVASDVLRAQSADLLFSQDRLVIYDEERNHLSVPLVRPEDAQIYRFLRTRARSRSGSMVSEAQPDASSEISTPGVIGRPSRLSSATGASSPPPQSPVLQPLSNMTASDVKSEDAPPRQILLRSSTDITSRSNEENTKPSTEPSNPAVSDRATKTNSGVWSNSWRSAGNVPTPSTDMNNTITNTVRNQPRVMKVLRPSTNKTMANATRIASNPGTPTTLTMNTSSLGSNVQSQAQSTTSSAGNSVSGSAGGPEAAPTPTRQNPIGSASAFGWLNSGRRTTLNGSSSGI